MRFRAALAGILAVVTLSLGPSHARAEAPATAEAMYESMLARGTLEIAVTLGYDELGGGHDEPSPTGDARLDASRARQLDAVQQAADIAAVKSALLACADCRLKPTTGGPGYQLYTSTIDDKGRRIPVQVTFIYAEPGVAPAQLKAWFAAIARRSPATIAMGHSRHGSGFPDFGPSPSLDGKVFYKDPRGASWQGFDQNVFSQAGYQLLFLDSCSTRPYYERVLRDNVKEKNPSQLGLILTNFDSDWDDYPASVATFVGGLMRREPPRLIVAKLEAASLRRFTPSGQKLYATSGVPLDEAVEADQSALKPAMSSTDTTHGQPSGHVETRLRAE